jgi:hypothetical protein
MNGQLVEDQTPGSSWVRAIAPMLHERMQVGPLPELCEQAMIFEELESQMARQESEFFDTLSALKRLFIFADPAPVEQLLKTHRSLAPILIESASHLKDCFGDGIPFTLDIMPDEGPPRVVYVLALWRGESVVARAALLRFDELWWMENLRRAGGRIVFDYELIG